MAEDPSIPCEWNGKVYDLDLTSYTGLDYDELEQRTGESWRTTYTQLLALKPNSMKAAFWLTDRRDDPDLKWSTYAGPPARVVMAHLVAVRAAIVELGKAMTAGMDEDGIREAFGLDDSPSDVDTPPPSTTP